MFITFEGPEGCGKSTHAKLLVQYLESHGLSVCLTREPGGTNLGKEIRSLLLKPEQRLDKSAEIFLFAADRAQHITEVIKPALAAGQVVLCDRYIDSTLAYQLGGRKLPEDMVRYLNMVATDGLLPDLTILLDVPAQIGLSRAKAAHQTDRFEQEKIQFHEQVRKCYLSIAAADPKRVKVVASGEREIAEVQGEIRKIIDNYTPQ